MKNHPHYKKLMELVVGNRRRLAKPLATFSFAAAVGVFFPVMHALAANQVLSGNVPPGVADLQPLGNLDGAQELSLAIALPLRNQQDLEELLQQIYDPVSANFHQYLTPEHFTQRFGPTEQDYQAVVAFAQANNLTVTCAHSNRVILDVTGKVADIEGALHVNMLVYQHPTEARTFYAPDVEPSLDLTLPIQGIEGLNDYALPQPHCIATPLGNVGNPIPNAGSGPGGTYWGYDFRDAYLPGVTNNGSGQIVGLLEFDGYTASDIIYYETNRTPHLPNVTLTNVLLEGFDGLPSGLGVEVPLDIDMAISMAPGLSEVIVYEAKGGGGYWWDLLNRMADDNLAKQLSCSWFKPGGLADPVSEGIFEQMAAQGQSMFAASGDYDAFPEGTLVPFPDDSPHVTLVGGTELTTSGPEGSWESEAVWNWNNQAGCQNWTNFGSGGGISTYYAIPYWQTNVNMTNNQGSATMRNLPDVALTADHVFVYTNGSNFCLGGTSCAAPLWAGLTALVNQQAAAGGQPPVGFLNPALYAIGKLHASDFHNITNGNNTNTASPNLFFAVPGYNLCSGWGTPAGQSLINDLSSAGSCLLAPAGALNTNRLSHTATPLPDGSVLVAGGIGASGSTTVSAELYYPANGTWTNTGRLTNPRAYHTATLLPNGLVLVAGGTNGSPPGPGGTGPLTLAPCLLASAELYNPVTATWALTGSLYNARQYHTETLLPSGLVLVAGGLGTNGALASSELYNPATGTWAITGSLKTARMSHTATLLPNGLVLVAGGLGASGSAITNAELYNPASRTWTNTGSLNTARGWYTATLPPSGLVLAAGGFGASGSAVASAELYNPAAGTWTTTRSLNTAHEYHTATLLPDGQVLVAAGYNTSGYLTNAEVYDPAIGTWTWTCSLNTARDAHTATLLSNGLVLVAGGADASGPLASAELYGTPIADTNFLFSFLDTGSMNPGRCVHTATLLSNGLVLVAGGYNYGLNGPIPNANLYTPLAGTWTNTGSLNTARYWHTATLLPNESVLVAGGTDAGNGQGGSLPYAELYSPATGVWTDTGSLHTDRVWHTATLLINGMVLVAGGYSDSTGILASAELYNPAAGTWANTGSLNTARMYHTATLLPNGWVLVAAGGDASGDTASAELYNPASGTWTNTGSLNTARAWHTATLLPTGLVLIAGGENAAGNVIASAELYYPASGTWTNTGSLNNPREYDTETLLPTGLVLVAAGYGASDVPASAELYNPATGTWAYTGSLNTGRFYHTATLLPSGIVLIAGGEDSGGNFFGSGELFFP